MIRIDSQTVRWDADPPLGRHFISTLLDNPVAEYQYALA